MTDPIAVLEAMAAKAREIPELVAECRGDSRRITAWVDQYPDRTSLRRAQFNQDEETAFFALERVSPAFGQDGYWWEFAYVVSFRPREEQGFDQGGIWRMYRALANGSTADGRRFLHQCFSDYTSAPRTINAQRVSFMLVEPDVLDILEGRILIYDKEA